METGRELWMPCRDGVRLATRLWRPDPAGPHGPGPWPVLLMRQPYGRAIASTVTYAHPCWYASHGFLVVVQDVRGCGDSEGDFGGFVQEGSDDAAAADVLRCRMSHGLELRDSVLQVLHLFPRRFECRLQLIRVFRLPSEFGPCGTQHLRRDGEAVRRQRYITSIAVAKLNRNPRAPCNRGCPR